MSIQDNLSINNSLNNSSILTKKIGGLKARNGKTISEHFDVGGISLWCALEPYIALYLIPQELSGNLTPALNNKLRPHVSLAKRRLVDFIRKLRGLFINTNKIEANLISFGFSNYMYRDVLKKTTEKINKSEGFRAIVLTEDFTVNPTKGVRKVSMWSFWNISSFISSFFLRRNLRKSLKELKKELVKNNLLKDVCSTLDLNYTFNWILNFHAPLMVDKVILANNLVKNISPSIFLCPDCATL